MCDKKGFLQVNWVKKRPDGRGTGVGANKVPTPKTELLRTSERKHPHKIRPDLQGMPRLDKLHLKRHLEGAGRPLI